MASYNKVLLMGNFVRDPELRVTPSGLSVCRCVIACSRTIRSEKIEGGSREETTFVEVESFGKQAETIAKYFNKGRPIFVEGRLRLNEWQNQAGEKRSKLIIVLENFVFVGPNPTASSQTETLNVPLSISSHYETAEKSKSDASSADADEDVPF